LQNHPSAAKAALSLSNLAARLKSCPFKTAQRSELLTYEAVASQRNCAAGGTQLPRKRSYTTQEVEVQQQILRLTTPKLKKALGAPFAQDDSSVSIAAKAGLILSDSVAGLKSRDVFSGISL
jgi:hypothetical protein